MEENNEVEFEDYEDIPLYEEDRTVLDANTKLTYDLVKTMMDYYSDIDLKSYYILLERLKKNDLLNDEIIQKINNETVVKKRRTYRMYLKKFGCEPFFTQLFYALLRKTNPANIIAKRTILHRIRAKYSNYIARTL